MGGTYAGGAKAAATNKLKHGADYYVKLGAMGGKVKNPLKGYGRDSRTWLQKLVGVKKSAATSGRKGGRISKRRSKKGLTND